MTHFKAFNMMNMQYEIKIWEKILNKATNDKNQHPPPPFEHTAPLTFTLWECVYTIYMWREVELEREGTWRELNSTNNQVSICEQ